MRIDLYTKTVLTIIAICLVINTVKDFEVIPRAYANEPLRNDTKFAGNNNYGLVPLNSDGTIDVNIKSSSEMNVNISRISTMDELDVNIDEVGGSYISRGAIKVDVIDK